MKSEGLSITCVILKQQNLILETCLFKSNPKKDPHNIFMFIRDGFIFERYFMDLDKEEKEAEENGQNPSKCSPQGRRERLENKKERAGGLRLS